MDSDKNSSGDSGGPGWQPRGQPDSPSESRDPRFTTFEQDCLDELELESAEDEAGSRSDGGSSISKDDFVDTWSSQHSSHRLWLAFQHTASSISSLYRDQCTLGASWCSFQTAAEACTDMYKESQEILRVSIDEARKEGRKQLVKDLVMWMKRRGRRGRHFRREELLAFLSGKAPPPASSSMRQHSGGASSGVTGATSAAVALGASHHLHHQYHHHPHHRKASAALFSSQLLSDAGGSNASHGRRSLSASPSLTEANLWMGSPSDFASSVATTTTTGYFHVDGKVDANSNNQSSGLFLEPDLRSFRDAQAVQGLSGALSNIRVAGSPHSPHGGGGTTPPLLLSTTGGASPLRHTASPLDHNHQNRGRCSTPSGRQTPISSSSSSSGRGALEDPLHPYDADLSAGLPHGTVGGVAGVLSGENADPTLSTAATGYRKRSSSQSASHPPAGPHENYPASTAESPTRKRHRLV